MTDEGVSDSYKVIEMLKDKKLNIISNILFWVYILIYDFTFLGMAAASV